jgi:transcriptional regulator with XRE-family HTH domain
MYILDKNYRQDPVRRRKLNRGVDMATLGQRLQFLREERKIGQKEIAGLLKVSVSSIGKYENDERTPAPDAISRLADFFEVSADFLLGRSDIRDTAEKILARLNIGTTLPEEGLKELELLKGYIVYKYLICNESNR